jgi:hypothetical protein
MKIPILLAIVPLLACVSPATAAPVGRESFEQCVAIHLVKVRYATKLIEKKSDETLPHIRTDAARMPLAQIAAEARTIDADVKKALAESLTVDDLQSTLDDGSVSMAALRSMLAGLAIDLTNAGDLAGITSVEEMNAALDNLRKEIPAEDPARGRG